MSTHLEDELTLDDSYEPIGHAEAMHDLTRDEGSPKTGLDNILGEPSQQLPASHISPALLANYLAQNTSKEKGKTTADIGKIALSVPLRRTMHWYVAY